MDEFWKAVQDAGKYNPATDDTEPWEFAWGANNMDDLRKGLATVMPTDFIDKWLNQPNEAFPDTPQKIIDEGDYEAVWLAIYNIGTTGAMLYAAR